MSPTATDADFKPRIAIIGAGFAGLRCADILLQHDFSVTMFEARNRLGGRVAQSEVLGHTVDMGPNWIHGSENNPILDIAKKTGTELHALDEDEAIYDCDGKLLDAEEAREYGELLWGEEDGLISQAFEYSEQHTKTIDPQRSVYDFFEEKAQDLFIDLPAEEARRKRETLLNLTEMWGAYVGSPVQRQSLKFFWFERTVEGEDPFVSGTYARILEEVARPAREGAELRVGRKAERVRTNTKEGNAKGKVAVRTTSGEEEEFDEVVVTVPLGYLKRNPGMFDPALPPRLTSAIDSLGYGNLDKVYITFPSAFWNEPLPADKMPNVAVNPATLHELLNDSRDTSPRAKHQFPGFTQFLPPTYASDTNPERWDQCIMNLAALPPSTAHPTLLFYIHGPCAKYIASLLPTPTNDSDQPQPHTNLKALLPFFLPYISLLPNYSGTSLACTPTRILATAWANDELAGYGSYTNFQVGLEKGDEDIEVLREGLPERGLWFAGEHTAPLEAAATTTGAYLSGQRVGERIARAYGREGNTEGDDSHA